ncbi:MAG: hypothetical protein JO316_04685 [Abitibacteriaceae bacterium]|nr:hypothetical protein [Abditibacteriaceae bacterium]
MLQHVRGGWIIIVSRLHILLSWFIVYGLCLTALVNPGYAQQPPTAALSRQLVKAVERQDLASLKATLAKGADPNSSDTTWLDTPVFIKAVSAGNSEAVTILLGNDAEISQS